MNLDRRLLEKELGLGGGLVVSTFVVLLLLWAIEALDSWKDGLAAISIAAASGALGIVGASLMLFSAGLISEVRVRNLNRIMNVIGIAAAGISLFDSARSPAVSQPVLIAVCGGLLSAVVLYGDLAGWRTQPRDVGISAVALVLVVVGSATDFRDRYGPFLYDGCEPNIWATQFAALAIGSASVAFHACWMLLFMFGEIAERGSPVVD